MRACASAKGGRVLRKSANVGLFVGCEVLRCFASRKAGMFGTKQKNWVTGYQPRGKLELKEKASVRALICREVGDQFKTRDDAEVAKDALQAELQGRAQKIFTLARVTPQGWGPGDDG